MCGLRLAGVLLDEKKYDEALGLLETKHGESFDGLYADLKGDILSAMGKLCGCASRLSDCARKDRQEKERTINIVQMKLDACKMPTTGFAYVHPDGNGRVFGIRRLINRCRSVTEVPCINNKMYPGICSHAQAVSFTDCIIRPFRMRRYGRNGAGSRKFASRTSMCLALPTVFGWHTGWRWRRSRLPSWLHFPALARYGRTSSTKARRPLFSPVFDDGAVYGAGVNGRLVRFDAVSGKETASVDTERRLSGGVGAGEGMLLVGTFKGEILAYDEKSGKALWTAQVSTEVLSPPRADGGVVVVRTGDGRIFGLEAATGKRKWVYQGATPSLTVRSFAGVVISEEAVFAGFAGGKLIALNLNTGAVKWEAVVSRPRGATELERITDVTSLPVIDGQRVCAVAYQGRVACFEMLPRAIRFGRGTYRATPVWRWMTIIFMSAKIGAPSPPMIKMTERASGGRNCSYGLKLSPPLVRGDQVVVADSQGYRECHQAKMTAISWDGRRPTAQSPHVLYPCRMVLPYKPEKGEFMRSAPTSRHHRYQAATQPQDDPWATISGFVPFCK